MSRQKPVSWLAVLTTLFALLPTINGVLLAIQTTIAEPEMKQLLPAWVFVIVNVSVIVAALVTKIVSQILASSLIRSHGQRPAHSADQISDGEISGDVPKLDPPSNNERGLA